MRQLLLFVGLTVSVFLNSRVNIALGQTIAVRGIVKSQENHKPLEYATVFLYGIQEGDTAIIAQAVSDNEGRYTSNCSKNSLIKISCSSMGYSEYNHVFKQPVQDNIKHDITLRISEFQLDSVTVVSKPRPLSINGDTTTYLPSKYSDGTEKTLEEVLKKLPGVKVDENGTISYKGKQIEKVLIEGEDIFSEKYQMITRTLNPTILSKIEAIENYTNNPVYRQFKKSNKTVLNLSLNEDKKNTIFGNIKLAKGTERREEISPTLFSLVGKIKMGVLLNHNDLMNEILPNAQYYLGNRENENHFLNFHIGEVSPYILTDIPHSGVLRRERYVFNNTQLFGYSFSIKKDATTKFYGNIIGALDKKNVDQATNFRYFLPNQNELIFEDSVKSSRNSKNIIGVLKFEKSWGDHTFLQINSSISKSFSLLDQSYISQNLFFPEDFDNENKSNIWGNSQNVYLSRKVSKTLMMDIKMKYLHNSNSQYIQNNSHRYNEAFGMALPIQQINQPISQSSDRFSFFTELLKTRPKFRYKIKANIETGKEEISNSLWIDTASRNTQIKESMYSFNKKVLILGGEMITKLKKSNFAIGLDVLYVNLSASSIDRFSKPVLS
ncbi:MAG: hypothetical protein ACRCVT_16035, partial [Leadbetterella sp.]